MSKRKSRTPQEIAADLQNKADAAKARAALKDAENLSEVQVLSTALAQVKADRLVAKRKFSGPQSFAKRLAKHAAWIDEITAGELLAQNEVEGFENVESYLKIRLADLITSYMASKQTQEDRDTLLSGANHAVENMPSVATDSDLVDSYVEARGFRKTLTTKVEKSEEKENEAEA